VAYFIKKNERLKKDVIVMICDNHSSYILNHKSILNKM